MCTLRRLVIILYTTRYNKENANKIVHNFTLAFFKRN